ncbi:AI-2E family transporter [Ottowia sp.]|uniref:AI-2E family transporter n=1 Tax=Ottowia sp. TaxID=1898956 RepID=UPI003A8C7F24
MEPRTAQIPATPLSDEADAQLSPPNTSRLMDVLIRAGLIAGLAVLCYQIFSPFLTLMAWALIMAIAQYPLHQMLARRMGGRQGWAAAVLVLLGLLLIVVPTAVLMNSMGDSVQQLIHGVQANTLQVPPPRESIARWPLIGQPLFDVWQRAHADLPALVHSLQPKIGEVAKAALGFVAGIGLGVLMFIGAIVIAGLILSRGALGPQTGQAIFARIMGPARGVQYARLAATTVRAVAQGVIGVALIQSLLIGLCLLVAGVPLAGILSVVVLILAIAQLPALLVTLPAIVYIWMSGEHTTVMAIVYTVLLAVAGMVDNVLKPLMLGRGVDAPMPVILLGALGGMASGGIVGMFVGATLLALGYQVFMGWVREDAAVPPAQHGTDS